MISKRIILFFLVLLLSTSNILAAHFIIGKVNDALDGTFADDHTVILWNPTTGMNDNLTDIIGVNGNSGTPNTYMIDCELLNNGCDVNDLLSIKVIDNGDSYISGEASVSITGAGFDLAPNITLNSPPNSTLNSPQNNQNFSLTMNFNCSATDFDGNLANITLHGNWSEGWHANETQSASGNFSSVTFTKNLTEGTYKWNCLTTDNLSVSRFAQNNRTFNLDQTAPTIISLLMNETYLCGTASYVRINCTTTDSFSGLDTVTIRAQAPSFIQNYTAQLLSENIYFVDVLANETGNWQFTCIANDTAGNSANSTSNNLSVHPSSADLIVYSSEITFSKNNPLENELITIYSIIHNNGCTDTNNFLAAFYNEDPSSSGQQIGNNISITLQSRTNTTINISWNAEIGPSNIFVSADLNNTIIEANELNNKANKTINVNAWQDFYGNISSTKILADLNVKNLTLWLNDGSSTGNVFVADKESIIDWSSLISIGKNLTGSSTLNDFSEIDSIFNMTSFNDSVSNMFTTDGNTPKNIENFIVHSKLIESVPIINSTDSDNFITGILWDSSTNTDGEFSQIDNEKLVFVTKINRNSSGAYGNYDYEIKIPVRLREQNPTDSSEIYFYYELN